VWTQQPGTTGNGDCGVNKTGGHYTILIDTTKTTTGTTTTTKLSTLPPTLLPPPPPTNSKTTLPNPTHSTTAKIKTT